MKNMSNQPDDPNTVPVTMDVCRIDLGNRIHELVREGVFIPRMKAMGNSTYRLTLCFPPGPEKEP